MSELDTIGFGLVIIAAAVGGAAILTWFERRLLGVWQDRYGPNRLGPFGALQVAADMIKLLTKHDWVPPFADRAVFVFAPTGIVVGCRTLSNGQVTYWEDGTAYEPTEHLPAVLVATNLRRRHVFALAEDLTATTDSTETLPLWQGSDIERDTDE